MNSGEQPEKQLPPREQYEKQLEMFEQLQLFTKALGLESMEPDESEAWRGEDATPEETMLKMQVIANGYLNLISRQLFWLQGLELPRFPER